MQYAQQYPTPYQPSDMSCDLAGMTCPQYKAAYPAEQFFCNASASK